METNIYMAYVFGLSSEFFDALQQQSPVGLEPLVFLGLHIVGGYIPCLEEDVRERIPTLRRGSRCLRDVDVLLHGER